MAPRQQYRVFEENVTVFGGQQHMYESAPWVDEAKRAMANVETEMKKRGQYPGQYPTYNPSQTSAYPPQFGYGYGGYPGIPGPAPSTGAAKEEDHEGDDKDDDAENVQYESGKFREQPANLYDTHAAQMEKVSTSKYLLGSAEEEPKVSGFFTASPRPGYRSGVLTLQPGTQPAYRTVPAEQTYVPVSLWRSDTSAVQSSAISMPSFQSVAASQRLSDPAPGAFFRGSRSRPQLSSSGNLAYDAMGDVYAR
jgi:hypothetical protein